MKKKRRSETLKVKCAGLFVQHTEEPVSPKQWLKKKWDKEIAEQERIDKMLEERKKKSERSNQTANEASRLILLQRSYLPQSTARKESRESPPDEDMEVAMRYSREEAARRECALHAQDEQRLQEIARYGVAPSDEALAQLLNDGGDQTGDLARALHQSTLEQSADPELQRALELSQHQGTGDESELALALEQSMRDPLDVDVERALELSRRDQDDVELSRRDQDDVERAMQESRAYAGAMGL